MKAWRFAALLVLGGVCAYALHAWAYAPCLCILAVQSIGGSTDAASKAPTEYHTTLQARANLSRIAALERPCRMDIRLLMMKAANERLLGRREEALATYRGILQFEPRPEVYLAGGRTLSEMGRFDEAIEWYLPAVRFNPALQLDIDNFGEELGRRVRARLAGGR